MKVKKHQKKKPNGSVKRSASSSINDDPFFTSDTKKRKSQPAFDEEIDSDEEEDIRDDDEEEDKDPEEMETVDEKRQRVAKAYLDNLRKITKKEQDEENATDDDADVEYDLLGERDSLVASKLMKLQQEESGRLRREIASRVQKPETSEKFTLLVKNTHPVTSLCLSHDDLTGFSSSKDGTILQWDVETGKKERFQWPNEETLKSHGTKNPNGRTNKHSRTILALAVSPDGRYLASGGSDRHVHLWDTRNKTHIQAFPGHRGAVSSLSFREGTSELFSGSFDRSVKIWNVEDRAYIQTLFGHQGEVVSLDCLRKERVLSVGRDRTMQLFKVPEESRLIFRASQASLESCCFIDNDDFLTGSDDGSIELWCAQKKKPVSVFKNAHSEMGNCSSSNSWVGSVCVCNNSDLAASGAGNGFVRLWTIENTAKVIKPLFDLSLDGFVNSLAFARSGKFLVAGVGKEHRMGRWGKIASAENGVAIKKFELNL